MSRASTEQTKLRDDLNVDQFKELQQLARQSSGYDPYCRELLAIEAGLFDAEPSAILEQLELLAELHQTCPRFYYLRARAFEALGEDESMQRSIHSLQVCLRLIAATGDGDKNSPFSIAFITDQGDLVRAFGEEKRCQQTVNNAKQQFDVVTAHTGREFWFDVTEITKPQFAAHADVEQSRSFAPHDAK